MKKFFKFALAALAAIAVFACQKKDPTPSGGDDNTPSGGDGVETLTYNVDVMAGSNEYVIKDIKADVLAKFKAQGISEDELFKALGSYTSGTATVDGREGVEVTNQVNQTVDWVPIQKSTGYAGAAQYTCAGFDWFGWWFNEAGDASNWWNSVFAINLEFREADDPEADEPTYHSADQWNLRVWCKGADVPAVGTKLSYEMAFVCGDNIMTDTEYYELHIVVNVNIVDMLPAPTVNVKGTKDINVTSEFIPNWGATSIEDQIDYAAIQSAIGISANEAVNYGVNADGSLWPVPASNNWYDVNGNVSAYGESCGIDINKDSGEWTFCFYPNEELTGKTLKGAVAFVNPNTLDAYIVKLTVVTTAQTTWEEEVTVMLIDEAVETYPDFSGLAKLFGYEDVDGLYDALCNGDVYPVGVNADGSQYLNEEGKPWYSQIDDYDSEWGVYMRGVFFSKEGNCTTWNSGSDHFYSTMYWYEDEGKKIEVDFSPFAVNPDDLGSYNFVWGFVKGEQVGYIKFNITLDNLDFNTTEVATVDVSVSQTIDKGYGGESFTLDAAKAALLGEGDYYMVDKNGGVDYTANGGFWFNADGEVSSYADGSFFVEPAEEDYTFNTGIHPGNVTAAGVYTTTFRIANPAVGVAKHITVNFTLTVK